MKGNKRISELITDPAVIHPGRINIIEANVSAGKTWFALNTLPTWTNPEKILYLIDTNNGELRIQEHILIVSRQTYALADYCSGKVWGEGAHDADGKMPVMTYSGFGSEVRHGRNFNWQDFDYIVCDEMQNLVNYQKIPGNKINLEAAEDALRTILGKGKTRSPSARRLLRSGSASESCAMTFPLTEATSADWKPSRKFLTVREQNP